MSELTKHFRENIIVHVIAAVLILSGFIFIQKMPARIDEIAHYYQILIISSGKDFFPRGCPYLPGFHLSMAFLGMLINK